MAALKKRRLAHYLKTTMTILTTKKSMLKTLIISNIFILSAHWTVGKEADSIHKKMLIFELFCAILPIQG